MVTDEDIEVVTGRMRVWQMALERMSDPEVCRRLLVALDEGDEKGFHGVVDDWRLPGEVGCIELVDTITRFVHTGDYQPVESCSFPNLLRPPNPSTTSGRGYQLPDGSILWLTEAEWWETFDRAVADEGWRNANKEFLQALGILVCTFELLPSIKRFDIDKRYTICPPTWDPRA